MKEVESKGYFVMSDGKKSNEVASPGEKKAARSKSSKGTKRGGVAEIKNAQRKKNASQNS
jgi:hypothetical protein